MIATALENEMKDRTKRQFFYSFIQKMKDKYINHEEGNIFNKINELVDNYHPNNILDLSDM